MTTIWAHPSQGPLYGAVVEYLAALIWGKARPMPEGTVMAVARGAEIIAAALFHNYDPDAGTIEISAASADPRCASRAVLFELFDFAFSQLGCQAVVLRVSPDNSRVARMAKAYGFERYDIPRLRGRDQSEAVFILGDDVWRGNGFHKDQKHGQ